ncbi:WD40 repeat-like protein [Rhizopus microsporus ATCC 52813]|uniref:WD40 repeat-like protein n=2 Tax=Rhizopus microsporus TaxID=58291 RepID=A0A2G4SII2_RHIZD|nr:WD40 repeat-like protein [Rhizopus microsporus ATCC 52813]PHZ08561.1 WD40 repeat-like protein [Rhizopus microsporus ATCC 52813]
MDGYLQSTLAATSLQHNLNRNSSNNTTKIVVHFPPSNKNFNCTEIHTLDGVYPLLHEVFFDTIAPQYSLGTRASIINFKKRHDSSDEDSIGSYYPGLSMTPVIPIPNASTKSYVRNLSYSSSPQILLSQQQQQSSYMTTNWQDNNSLDNKEDASFTPHSVGSISSLFGKTNGSQLSTSIGRSSGSNNSSKPKNHLSKTKSTFVLRFIIHENLQKILSAKTVEDDYCFFNIGSSFIWVDSKNKPTEPLSRVVFSKSYPLCHDINEITKCDDHLDVIIGFSTGDIVWYDPFSSKYVRLNKGGCLVSSAVHMIKWLPGSEDLFVAAFKDGSMMIMSKERDDQPFSLSEPNSWIETQFYTFRPHKGYKHNPVSYWKLSKEAITDFSFSPDGVHLAVTGADGQLKIIDYKNERLTDIFSSYFGQLNCVSWSPDGHYIVTGGQDDLVTIWSFVERRMVARCHGHKSWITSIAFDPWKCDEQSYRFASVGEDCNLILWDFSMSALQKPKHPRITLSVCASSTKWPPPPPPSAPISFTNNNNADVVERKRSLKIFKGLSSHEPHGLFNHSNNKKRGSKSAPEIFIPPVLHPPIKKNQAAILQPTTIHNIHADPCVSIAFKQDYMITTDRRGRIRIWGRP